jgi:hypothetical protein
MKRKTIRDPNGFKDWEFIEIANDKVILRREGSEGFEVEGRGDWQVWEPEVVSFAYIKDKLLAIHPEIKIEWYVVLDTLLERTRAHINKQYYFVVDSFSSGRYYRDTVDYAILTLQRNMERL